MRSRSTMLVLSALALSAASAAAQQLAPRIPPVRAAEPAGGTAAAATLQPAAPGTRHSLLSTVLYGAGGAVLGSWAGYMTSQIVWSDWQDHSQPGGVNRLHYTLTGAGVGALLGAVLGHHIRPGPAAPGSAFGTRPAITTAQIEASDTRTVEELIQLLRPQWLNPRGNDYVQIVDSTALPALTSAGATDVVRVYLDGQPLGGPDELANIPTPEVLRVEYYDMKAATMRWGAGHSHGAIDVITASGRR